jgi:hypothetical protein
MGFLWPFLRKLSSSPGKLRIWLDSRQNLRPVPDYCCVIRLGRVPKDFKESGKILAIQLDQTQAFELSSLDKQSIPPHLSVWISALTTPEQAYRFLPENSLRRLVIQLEIQEIRQIVGCSGQDTMPSGLLDVIWVHLTQNINGQESRDNRPGARGHAGITGLDEKSAPSKLLRKDLRSKLAEIASKDCYLLFDD